MQKFKDSTWKARNTNLPNSQLEIRGKLSTLFPRSKL